MADIFGKTPDDYTLVRDLHKAGKWDRQQADWAARRPFSLPLHDFDAMGAGVPVDQQRASEDQQAVGYLTNNLLAIQTAIDEIMYTTYRLPEFLYMNTAIAEGADSYGIRVQNRVGRAIRVSAPAYDAPSATVSTGIQTQPMHYYGLDAIWSIDELRGAMFGGTALDTQSIEAAVMGSLETMESVGLTGGGYANTTGLLNHAVSGTDPVPVNLNTQAASSTFAELTSDQMRDLINGDISSVINVSNETLGRNINTGMTVYLPGAQYDLLSSKYVGDHAERTIMRTIMEDNPWTHFTGNPINIARVLELDGAGASDTDRMVVGLMHGRVAEMGVSIMPRVLRIVDKGRVICAQVESKYSPTWVKRPGTIYYRDAI